MNFELIRSDRKSIGLEVTRDGRVLVRAPRAMSRKTIDDFVNSHEKWIKNALERQADRAAEHPEPTPAKQQEYRNLVRAKVTALVAHYAPLMGVVPTGITVTGAKTRFGSCSGKNSLSFSWRLAEYPDAAIEYVVVHELAHIRHHNHSADFYAFVARFLPDYKEREKLLRK